MSHAHLTASNSLVRGYGRAHWTVTPNLDTWTNEEPNIRDAWAVLKSGAELRLARTRDEAEDRAQMVHRERQLAKQARRSATRNHGFGPAPKTDRSPTPALTGSGAWSTTTTTFASSRPSATPTEPRCKSDDPRTTPRRRIRHSQCLTQRRAYRKRHAHRPPRRTNHRKYSAAIWAGTK